MITANEKIWYAEVYYVLNYLGIEYIRKIPKKLLDVIENARDKNYKFDWIVSIYLNLPVEKDPSSPCQKNNKKYHFDK